MDIHYLVLAFKNTTLLLSPARGSAEEPLWWEFQRQRIQSTLGEHPCPGNEDCFRRSGMLGLKVFGIDKNNNEITSSPID